MILTWDKYESHLLNEGLTKKRLDKLKCMYKLITRSFNKPFDKLTRSDIEFFLNQLNRNKFKKENGEPYSGSSKSDIRKFIKLFWKWFKGNNEYFPTEVSWIKTKIPKDERPQEKIIITYNDVIRLSNTFKSIEHKILTLLLFDSGFRIQELLSVKKKNITFESFDDENNRCFWIRCNVSKTMTRKVDIPLFTEDIKTFMNSSYIENLSDDDLIFPLSYNSYLKTLHNASKKILNIKLSPHCFRHSSATYYAKVYGDTILLANRYGWSYSAQELKTYVRRSGIYQRQGAKKVFTNEIVKLQQDNIELRKELENIKGMIKKKAIIEVAKNEII